MLVLDEPTSALDPRSEALIQESLEALHNELTLFIIAHRMSTLSICNRVMVVLDGTLNAFDTLPELMQHNDYYRLASGLAARLENPDDLEPDALTSPDLRPSGGDGAPSDRTAALEPSGPPLTNGHSQARPAGETNLISSLRQSADDIARVTSLDALIGRPTVLEKQARLLLSDLPALPEAIAAVQSRLGPDAPTPDDEPLFVFSAGWRSGSTLLQRLVVSSDRYLLWGEPYHSCDLVRRLAESLLPFASGWPPREYLYDWISASTDGDLPSHFIANLYPPVPALVEAHRQALRSFLAPPPDHPDVGWGMKEVRLSGEHALYLRMLFPKAKFIFLVRNPVDAYSSYRERPRWFDRWPREQIRTPHAYGRMWSRLAESFLDYGDEVDAAIVRYEDLVAGGESLTRLEQVLGGPVDRSVLSSARVGGSRRSDLTRLPAVEARMLAHATRTVAPRFGYAVESG
jgi:energy-coupling factor transporter ATP-binding protein EcfA2